MASHLLDWESMASRLFDADSLSKVQTQVEDMRRKELKLTDDLGNLQIEINSLNRYVSLNSYEKYESRTVQIFKLQTTFIFPLEQM
jgi:hypothetical protein